MKVELSPEVKDYLHKKHKDVIEVYARKNYSERLDDNAPRQLVVHFGVPEENILGQFESYEVEGFKLYIEKDIVEGHQDVIVHMSKLLGVKFMDVDGLELHR